MLHCLLSGYQPCCPLQNSGFISSEEQPENQQFPNIASLLGNSTSCKVQPGEGREGQSLRDQLNTKSIFFYYYITVIYIYIL